MGKGGKRLQNQYQEIKKLQDAIKELQNTVVNIYNQIGMKEQVIEILQLQLTEIEMIDATCDTSDLIQMVDTTCDIDDLMQMIDAITNDLI